MTIPGNVGFQVHLIPARVHQSERVIFVIIVAEPRVVRKSGVQHKTAVFRPTVTLVFFRQLFFRPEDIGEILLFVFGKFLDLDGRSCPVHGSVWKIGWP